MQKARITFPRLALLKPALAGLVLSVGMSSAAIPAEGHDGKRLLDPPRDQSRGAAGKRSQANASAPQVGRYTADSLTLILYRFAFLDSMPIGLDSINKENETIIRRYSEWSGGRFKFIPKIHPKVFQLKMKLDAYRNNWYAWLDEVKAAIRATGVDPDNPPKNTTIAYYSKEFGYNSSGGSFSMNLHTYEAWAIMHELGHTLGLLHACGLEAGARVIGLSEDTSEFLDYGNPYDNMGMGYEADYNVVYKDFFGWISPEERWHITYPGTYRVYAQDLPERHGTIALTLPSGNGKYTYWLEYRDDIGYAEKKGTVLFNIVGYLTGGVRHDNRYWDTIPLFLDMTPNSGGFRNTDWWDEDFTDGGLAPGKSFTDPWGGFKVTTLRIGGLPHSKYSWAEVKVESVSGRGIGARGPIGIVPTGPRFNVLGQHREAKPHTPAPVLGINPEGKPRLIDPGAGR